MYSTDIRKNPESNTVTTEDSLHSWVSPTHEATVQHISSYDGLSTLDDKPSIEWKIDIVLYYSAFSKIVYDIIFLVFYCIVLSNFQMCLANIFKDMYIPRKTQ